MGWSLAWVSSANSDFNFDFGASCTEEQVRGFVTPQTIHTLPPIVQHNATASGTDVLGYLSESPAMNTFTLHDSAVYQTYTTPGRGLEILMNHYPILDRVPKGRDEGDAFQTGLRRHDDHPLVTHAAPHGADRAEGGLVIRVVEQRALPKACGPECHAAWASPPDSRVVRRVSSRHGHPCLTPRPRHRA